MPLTEEAFRDLKKAMRQQWPAVRSSHVDEVIAFGFGFSTYAALRVYLRRDGTYGGKVAADADLALDATRMERRLIELGYARDGTKEIT